MNDNTTLTVGDGNDRILRKLGHSDEGAGARWHRACCNCCWAGCFVGGVVGEVKSTNSLGNSVGISSAGFVGSGQVGGTRNARLTNTAKNVFVNVLNLKDTINAVTAGVNYRF
jgi:hypothetical protein